MTAESLTNQQLANVLLACIYQAVEDDVSRLIDPAKVASDVGLVYRRGRLAMAVDKLGSQGLLTVSRTISGVPDGGLLVTLTGAGLEEAETLFSDGWADGYRPGNGDEATVRPATTSALDQLRSQGLIPASDRVVQLDHNSPELGEASSAVETVAERLRGENELAAEKPEEFSQHLAEVDAGQRLLKAPRALVSGLIATLVVGLLWFLTEFAGAAVAPLIQTALKAIGNLLGLSLW